MKAIKTSMLAEWNECLVSRIKVWQALVDHTTIGLLLLKQSAGCSNQLLIVRVIHKPIHNALLSFR